MSDRIDERPRVRLPVPARTFGDRARRLDALAKARASDAWLGLLAGIARGQHAAARTVLVSDAPGRGEGPPLAPGRVRRDDVWRRMLEVVLASADDPALPDEARAAIQRLRAASPAELERLAGRVLAGAIPSEALAEATFVGAALQVWFSALASLLQPPDPGLAASACPICGAPPVAGLIDGTTRLKYLSCSLCGSEWNLPRIRCSACGEEARIGYYGVEGDAGAQAETCDSCRGYLKLFDAEVRPGADAMADDVATLALDVLLAEEGYRRIGASPWLAVAG